MIFRNVHMSREVIVSIQVLGKSDEQHGRRTYTLGPCNYSHHLSPLIGRFTDTKNPQTSKKTGPDGEGQKTERHASVVALAGHC